MKGWIDRNKDVWISFPGLEPKTSKFRIRYRKNSATLPLTDLMRKWTIWQLLTTPSHTTIVSIETAAASGTDREVSPSGWCWESSSPGSWWAAWRRLTSRRGDCWSGQTAGYDWRHTGVGPRHWFRADRDDLKQKYVINIQWFAKSCIFMLTRQTLGPITKRFYVHAMQRFGDCSASNATVKPYHVWSVSPEDMRCILWHFNREIK